jgi:hypothetical protein
MKEFPWGPGIVYSVTGNMKTPFAEYYNIVTDKGTVLISISCQQAYYIFNGGISEEIDYRTAKLLVVKACHNCLQNN